jgi:hypothetical protein
LPIARVPAHSEIFIESSASEEPLSVPVRVRVMAQPSNLNQRLLRPAAGLLSAGLLGCALGWALGRWGPAAPGWLTGLTSPPMSSAGVWMLVVGLFWALFGWLRGRSQPAAWPVTYATGRWALSTLVWSVAISGLAAAGHWAWNRLGPGSGTAGLHATSATVVLMALTTAILPAVQREIRCARALEKTSPDPQRRAFLRPLLWAAIGAILIVVVALGGRLLSPVWQQLGERQSASMIEQRALDLWAGLETGVNNIVDRIYLRYFDRRAPVRPTPTPEPGITPTSQSGGS